MSKPLHYKMLFPAFVLLLFTTMSFAQMKVVGKVSDNSGQAIPGATVVIQGKSGTITDIDGKFELQATTGDVLEISYIGYMTSTIKVTDQTSYSVTLAEETTQLEDVVVVGYTKEKKADISGAITVVKVSELAQESSANILTALQGRVPGLLVNSGGTPGGNDSQIVIRGLTTVNSGSSPLWVIDGVQTLNPSSLNPEEIESIQVLKDGASAAIYGTSAANGVIVVTTKKGKKGVSFFSLKSEVTSNMLRDNVDVLHSQQWADVTYQAQLGASISTPNHPVLINNGSGFTIPEYLDASQLQRSSDTRWVDVITDNSVSTDNGISYTRGTEKLSLFTAVNYAKDNGIQKFTYYERLNARVNASYKFFNDRLTIGENFLYSNSAEVKANEYENAILQNPLIPVYTELGDYAAPLGGGLQDKPNPLANLYGNQDNKQKSQRLLGNVYGEYKIWKTLRFNTTLNFDYGTFKFNTASRPFSVNGSIPSIFQNIMTEDTDNDYLATIWTNTLNYDLEFGKHRVALFAGIENTRRKDNSHSELVRGVDITDGYVVRDDAEFQTLDSMREAYKISQFGSVKYIYDNRYILSASVRRDGSSRFGPNNKYAVFPAASAAWNASNEKFLKESKVISNLKLRASWGVNGNDLIGDYLYLSSFIDNTVGSVIEFANYDIDGDGFGTIGGILQTRQANPDIKWEKTTQWNAGADIGFLNERLTFSTDFYIKKTNDLILNPVALAISGESVPPTINAGTVSNKGFEAVLSYHSKRNADGVNYGADLNFSTYKNEVESLDTDANFLQNGVSITRAGDPIASFYGLQADGIFRTPEEVAVHAEQQGKGLGRIRYRDINEDGVIDSNDRTIIGNPHPDFTYGINLYADYKGFDINLYLDGKQGNDVYNSQRYIGDFAYSGFNYGTNTLHAWTPSNANSNIPALSTLNSNNELQASSYYVEDGSYIRLKNISIGYNFKGDLMKSVHLTKLRIYAMGQNLFSKTSFTGFDYEVAGLSAGGIGVAGYGIPHTKTLTFGINANF